MNYVRKNDKIFLRIDKGEEIIETIKTVCAKEMISTASVSGIGATDNFEVGVFNLDAKKYDAYHFNTNHEINNVCGNVTSLDGKPYIHLHITCAGKNCKIVGGHLLKAVISITGELVIDVVDAKVTRKYNEELSINQITF